MLRHTRPAARSSTWPPHLHTQGWATSAMMKLMRLPFKCLRWIAGSPWEDEGEEEEKKKKKEEEK